MNKSKSSITNIEKYKNDLDQLISLGELLLMSMRFECNPTKTEENLKNIIPESYEDFLKKLPNFYQKYQSWYSESKILIRQLLPDRLDDFCDYYEKPKTRKEISSENYRIADYLQGITATWGYEKKRIAGQEDAIPLFAQQLAIVKSIKNRFESSLFDIRQLVQADLMDSELDAAKELAKNKYYRAAGAMAGVVLERHLVQVCNNHKLVITKKNPCLSDLNEILKNSSTIDIPLWRNIQYLSDIRNLCDHDKQIEPSAEQINDLISGVTKIIKTLF